MIYILSGDHDKTITVWGEVRIHPLQILFTFNKKVVHVQSIFDNTDTVINSFQTFPIQVFMFY